MPSSYYDIDSILAEEELVPCAVLLDFSHLAHLDPDAAHSASAARIADDGGDADASNGGATKKRRRPDHRLPEGCRIKMPLWAMEKWALLGYVRAGLPRHYGRRARERLEADPGSAELRSRNERFYFSGMLLVSLVERCSDVLAQASNRSRNPQRRNAHTAAMAQVTREAMELRRTLHLTYTGERMRRIFDWTLSSIDDDVTSFTRRLTSLERRLFQIGAAAAAAHTAWKNYGSRRIAVSETALRAAAMQTQGYTKEPARPVSPERASGERRNVRARTQAA